MTEITPALLSKRQAAKFLGIGRGPTLEGLIRDGHIRPVKVAGRIRIPLEQLQRIAREGTEPIPSGMKAPGTPSARRKMSRAGMTEAEKILALD